MLQSVSLHARLPICSALLFSGHGMMEGHLYRSSLGCTLPEMMSGEATVTAFTNKLDPPAQAFQTAIEQLKKGHAWLL